MELCSLRCHRHSSVHGAPPRRQTPLLSDVHIIVTFTYSAASHCFLRSLDCPDPACCCSILSTRLCRLQPSAVAGIFLPPPFVTPVVAPPFPDQSQTPSLFFIFKIKILYYTVMLISPIKLRETNQTQKRLVNFSNYISNLKKD